MTGYLAGLYKACFMKSKALTLLKTLVCSKMFFTALILCFGAISANASTYTPVSGTAVDAEELDGFWNKFATLASGTGGKLLSAGIILSSVWNRQVIGTMGMASGVIVGIAIPTIPMLIDKFSFCI